MTDPAATADRRPAWIDRSGRVRLRITGRDRVKFLHNLTTNDVKALPVGTGCEAFVTSPQGKTLGLVTLHAEDDAILLRADEGALEHLRPHFEKYAIFDDVALDDLGPRTFEWHVLNTAWFRGSLSASGVDLPGPADLASRVATLAGRPVEFIRESPAGRPDLTLIGARDDEEAILGAFLDACGAVAGFALVLSEPGAMPFALTRLVRVDPSRFEALRIEAGTPVFGRDITTATLPQEADRDARAISFTKGCYLGQETVARLDAMGHVNKILRGLLIDDEPRAEPAGDLPVVEPTSVAYSPRWGKRVGLAMVKVKAAAQGTRVEAITGGERFGAVVQELPMRPEAGVNRIADLTEESL